MKGCTAVKRIDGARLLHSCLRVQQLVRRRAARGQGLVEYAAILGFAAALVVVSLLFLEPRITTSLNTVSNGFH